MSNIDRFKKGEISLVDLMEEIAKTTGAEHLRPNRRRRQRQDDDTPRRRSTDRPANDDSKTNLRSAAVAAVQAYV